MTTQILRSLKAGRTSGNSVPEFSTFTFSSPDEAILRLKKGLPISYFTWLEDNIGLPEAKVASLLQIATRTLARRKKDGRLQQTESERVFRLGILFNKAIQIFGDKNEAGEWFKRENRSLGNKTPLEYSDTEIGAREVEDLLGRIEHGIF